MTWIDATYRCPFGHRVQLTLGRAPDRLEVRHARFEGKRPICGAMLTLIKRVPHGA